MAKIEVCRPASRIPIKWGMSAWRRESLATLVWFVALSSIVVGFWWYWHENPQAGPTPTPNRPADAQEVKVVLPADGDSLDVAPVSPGRWISGTDPVRVRLLGIDAPELRGPDGQPECWAEAARGELVKLAPVGASLWLRGDAEIRDRSGRYLMYAWTADGIFVNERLAANGAVRQLSIAPNIGYEARLRETVAEARADRRGLWRSCLSRI